MRHARRKLLDGGLQGVHVARRSGTAAHVVDALAELADLGAKPLHVGLAHLLAGNGRLGFPQQGLDAAFDFAQFFLRRLGGGGLGGRGKLFGVAMGVVDAGRQLAHFALDGFIEACFGAGLVALHPTASSASRVSRLAKAGAVRRMSSPEACVARMRHFGHAFLHGLQAVAGAAFADLDVIDDVAQRPFQGLEARHVLGLLEGPGTVASAFSWRPRWPGARSRP